MKRWLATANAITWCALASLAIAYVFYEQLHPCGMRAMRKDSSEWALAGCLIEYTPKQTWHNLFEREPRTWQVPVEPKERQHVEEWIADAGDTITVGPNNDMVRINRTGKRVDSIEVWVPDGAQLIIHEQQSQEEQ